MVFPKDQQVSESSKRTITKLLAPLKIRLKISDIKNEAWCQARDTTAAKMKKENTEQTSHDK